MTKRTALWLATAICLVLVGVVGFISYHGSRITVKITALEAQQRIDAALTSRTMVDKQVQVSSARVTFADNAIVIDADVSGKMRNRTVGTTIHAVGTPVYKSGSFYFHPVSPPVFSNFKVVKEAAKEGFFTQTKEILKKKIDTYIVEHGWEEVAEAFKAELKEWTVSTVQKGIVTALERHPLYTLKNDFKGIAVKAVLEKVEVVGDTLHVTLSLTQLAYTIFMAVVFLMLAISCIAFLVLNPEWGMALAVIGSIGS